MCNNTAIIIVYKVYICIYIYPEDSFLSNDFHIYTAL